MREIYGSTETAGVGWRASQDAPFTLFADVESRATEESSKHPNPVPELSRCGLPLALQDELNWIGPRSFHVGARHDRKVQIAGVNVSVEEVAEVLRAHPEVAAAAVRLDPATARLKAFVVPRAEAVTRDDLEALLRTHATQHLISAARPQAYTFGAELPVSAAGKPTDW